MILIIHIAIALLTILTSLYSVVSPKQASITTARWSVFATTMSGIGLAFSSDISIGRLCISGVVFVSICAVLLRFASSKLALAKAN